MTRRRKVRKFDVLTCIDGRRRGLTIQVLAHRGGFSIVRNDSDRFYLIKTSRLNGHGHWRFIHNPGYPLRWVTPVTV